MAKLRKTVKDKAKDLLRHSIVNFKQEESLDVFINETINDLYNLFETDILDSIKRYEDYYNPKVDQTIQCKGVVINGKESTIINVKS